MYSTESTQEGSSSVIFPIGINECLFKDVTFTSAKKDGTGNPVLSFNFVHENGAEINFKAWEVIPEKSKGLTGKEISYNKTIKLGETEYSFVKGELFTERLSIANAFDSFNRVIKHVTNRFDKDMVVSGSNYNEFSINLVKQLTKYKGTKLKIATEYKDQYVNVRKNVPFLAEITDNTTLEKLDLKIIKPVVTPTPESDSWSGASTTKTDDWS